MTSTADCAPDCADECCDAAFNVRVEVPGSGIELWAALVNAVPQDNEWYRIPSPDSPDSGLFGHSDSRPSFDQAQHVVSDGLIQVIRRESDGAWLVRWPDYYAEWNGVVLGDYFRSVIKGYLRESGLLK